MPERSPERYFRFNEHFVDIAETLKEQNHPTYVHLIGFGGCVFVCMKGVNTAVVSRNGADMTVSLRQLLISQRDARRLNRGQPTMP